MTDSDIKLCNDLKHKSLELEKEYIDQLSDPDDIKNRVSFGGLILYLYNNLFKAKHNMPYNRNSIIDYNNIDVMEYVYNNIYIYLCNKYRIEYTQNRFLRLLGIDKATFAEWGKNPNAPQFNFVKIVRSNSESSLSDSMLNGNLMAYATLKCWHGWTETPQTIQVIGSGINATPEQIAEKYGKQELPQLINQDIVDNN